MLISLLLASVAFAQDENQTEPIEPAENQLAKTFFDSKKIVFLGDSITYSGGFLTTLESCIIANNKQGPKLLNLGLSSETCSGDSEPAHPWPRPNVHERFERVLEKVQPDLLVVTYGMNDGIYHPFDEKRFENYQAGINRIIVAAAQSDNKLKVILCTPPPFDPLPLKQKNRLVKKDAREFNWKSVYENYDSEVLSVYSDWILEQEDRVAGCIDLRTPILEALATKRKTDPTFHFAQDGVHLNEEGHQLMGNTIANALGLDTSKTINADAKKIISERNKMLRDSWLSAAGHKRPNIKAGVEPAVAAKKQKALNDKLNKLLDEERQKELEDK